MDLNQLLGGAVGVTSEFGNGLARGTLRVGGNGWIPARLFGRIKLEQTPKSCWYGGGFSQPGHFQHLTQGLRRIRQCWSVGGMGMVGAGGEMK